VIFVLGHVILNHPVVKYGGYGLIAHNLGVASGWMMVTGHPLCPRKLA